MIKKTKEIFRNKRGSKIQKQKNTKVEKMNKSIKNFMY